MSKQVLTISPRKKIVFRGPYDKTCTSLVVLQNPIDMPVGFRCRTLQPRLYVVKPSKGILKPKESITLTIKLKRIKDLDSFDVKQQKFLIQSVIANSTAPDASLAEMFGQGAQIATSKLKATFEFLGDYRNALNGVKVAGSKIDSKIKSDSNSESSIINNIKGFHSTDSEASDKNEETDLTDSTTATSAKNNKTKVSKTGACCCCTIS